MRLISIPLLLTAVLPLWSAPAVQAATTAVVWSTASSAGSVPTPGGQPAEPLPWQQKELWLFGGGEPLCSSIEPEYCTPDSLPAARRHFAASEALTEKQYQCSADSKQRLHQLPHWPSDSRVAVHHKPDSAANSPRLAQLLAVLPTKPVSATQLATLLQPYGLNDDETALIEDACELLQSKADQQPKRVELYWPGTDATTRQLFGAFVQSAQARKLARSQAHTSTTSGNNQAASRASAPKATVLLLTASSYNPYEWVSYYQQLFEAAGAAVIWLPVEAAWSQQLSPDCSQLEASRLRQAGQLRRAELYPQQAAIQQTYCRHPERLLQAVEQADAVFINGGDQSLTLRALTNQQGQWQPFASRLLQRVRYEGVILGGSSAGNAVQAGRLAGDIAMISGGRLPGALRHPLLSGDIDKPGCALWQDCQQLDLAGQLSYRAQGGLQLFSLGTNDTHFFERRREARLLTLVSATGAGAGFGVDEATVLRARFADENSAELSVLGHGGVWIIESFTASKALQVPPPTGTQQIDGLLVSRIFAGDRLWFTRPTATTAGPRQSAKVDILTHSCHSQRQPAAQVDPAAYSTATMTELQLQWVFGQAGTVDACQLASGRWRYLQQPMQLQLRSAAASGRAGGHLLPISGAQP